MKVTADDVAQLLAASPPRLVPAHVTKAVRNGSSSWSTALFGLAFGSFGMVFVFFFFPWRLADELRLGLGGAQATGTVTAVNDTDMRVNKVRVREYHFAFTTAKGERQAGDCYVTGEPWSMGEEMTVRYLPGNPAVACIVDARLNKAGWAAGLVFVFPAVGFGMVAWFIRQRIRTGRILLTGQVAEVDVISVGPTHVKVNKQPVYAIVLTGPALGTQPVTVKRLNWADIELAQRHAGQKQPVFVLCDPRKPARLIFPEALIDP